MRKFTIKEEYLTQWTNDPEITTDYVIDYDEVADLAKGWDKDIETLLEQLNEVTEDEDNDNDLVDSLDPDSLEYIAYYS